MNPFLGLFFGLTVGNLLWQVMSRERDWRLALDRSFFQGVALFVAWILYRGQP